MQNFNNDIHTIYLCICSTSSFLRRLQIIGRQHNFFNPGYTPTEMEEIPAIYKKIIDGPASNLHNSFKNAKGILNTVKPVLRGHQREGQKLAA